MDQLGSRPLPAKIRPATAGDFDRVYPLLQELNSTRFTRQIWSRLFTNLWNKDNWYPGYVLDNGKELVGFLGGIYSEDEKSGQIICNLTAWIVKDEYRSSSIMLLMPFLRQKNTILTSLTSSPETYAVYKKLGFKDLETAARVIYPVPSLFSSYELISDLSMLKDILTDREKQCLNDHTQLDVWQLAIRKGNRVCYLLGTRRLGRGHIQKMGDVNLFREAISVLSGKICKSLKVKSLQVDERFLADTKILFSRKKTLSQPRQIRGNIDRLTVDSAYSELVLLATP